MFTFLKGEYRKKIAGEYHRRLSVFGLFFVLFFVLILIGLSLPTFINLRVEKNAILSSREAVSKKITDNGLAEIETRVKKLNKLTAIVEQKSGEQPTISVIEKIVSERGSGISISSLSMERKNDGWTVIISGKAVSREMLVDFSKKLAIVSSFSAVDLPVSSLAKSQDIPFTISLHSKF
ncbi:MAG: hypothetical protein Q7R72_01675 [bacterium]|nr:hypothetical protein [bacterium]